MSRAALFAAVLPALLAMRCSRPANADPVASSGCPAPRDLTPTDLRAGFLAPSPVRYVRPVDGDTAHFAFPDIGETSVRFLWVNTEESHGRRTTDFGLETARTVAGWFGGAHRFAVVREDTPANPGAPQLDRFDRTLGLVFMDDHLVQLRIVRAGLSPYYTDYGCAPEPVHTALLLAEADARAHRRGVWAPGHPTDYAEVLDRWIGGRRRACRPNPFRGEPYCR